MIEYYPLKLARLDSKKWDALVESHGTVFQLSDWLSIWEKSFPFKSSVYIAADNGEIIGGIPFCTRQKFKFKEAYSMPRGCYGGAVINDGADIEIRKTLEEEFTFWCMREDYTRINIIDFSPEVNTNLESFDVRPVSTHLLNLEYSSGEQLERMAESHRRNIPKAAEMQFELTEVKDLKDIETYYEMIKRTASRQKRKPFYRLEFYNAFFEQFHDSPTLYWPMVKVENRVLASAIVLIHRNMAVYWDGASNEEALQKGANFHLFWDLIQHLKEQDIELLNFGASPQKRPGLKRFKSGWGAERFGYFEYNYQKPVDRLVRKVRGFF
jgi:predicted N-acyltransferase